jgi:hypothetical protein
MRGSALVRRQREMRWDSVFRIERMLESIDRLVCVRLDGTYNIDRPSGAVASSKQIHMNEDTASTPERCAFFIDIHLEKAIDGRFCRYT